MSRMTTKVNVEERRRRIAALSASGLSPGEIAVKLSISITTVYADLKIAMDSWRSQMRESIEEHAARELQKIDVQIAQISEEWERSRGDATIVVEEEGDSTSKVTRTRKSQCGDPRYHSLLISLRDQRAKILGFYKPEKREVSGLLTLEAVRALQDDEP